MVIGRVSNNVSVMRATRRGSMKRWALALAASTVVGLGAVSSRADEFFDWLGELNNPVPVAGAVLPAGSTYIAAPTLDDSTVTQVAAYLASQQSQGKTLAVKVRAGAVISQATINAIYNTYNVKYTFADYEGATALTQTTALVTAIKLSTATGPSVSPTAPGALPTSFVGNFQIAAISTDSTHPNSVTYTSGNSNAEPYFTVTDFRASGVNMSNESLYPGDASFRNPVSGNSTAPNILSALFTLPISRLSFASSGSGVGQPHIPYVARFNNSDNRALSNGPLTSAPQFNTAGAAINGQAVAGQLLSRDDFEALILHYRMRGATSYQLLDPGVVGYTQAQEESDAAAGWSNSLVGSVLSGTNGRPATLGTTITTDGVLKTIESAGVVFSAVTNDNAVGPQLAILVSNLDSVSHSVMFNQRINGATLTNGTGNTIAAGAHVILRFTKSGGLWTPIDGTGIAVFNDPNLASRDGIGIPEPTSLSLIGLGALGVLSRRRRKA